jgi:hypothetical protein
MPTNSALAKKYNLEYQFKTGQNIVYHLDLKQNNTFVFQGIGEKNKVHLTFDLNIKVADKSKDDKYILNISIPKMVCEFFSHDQSISRINSLENTADAGMLRRMINQDIIIEISPRGDFVIQKGLEAFIHKMDINYSMKGKLLDTFSKEGFKELAHYLFPEYPNKRIQTDDSWQTNIKHFGVRNQNITTNYVLSGTGDVLKIKSADYIENQKTILNVSGSKFKYNLMGSSDTSFEVDAGNGWMLNCKTEIKQVSEDKTAELITNLKISR